MKTRVPLPAWEVESMVRERRSLSLWNFQRMEQQARALQSRMVLEPPQMLVPREQVLKSRQMLELLG